jgi:alkaline phosphatase
MRWVLLFVSALTAGSLAAAEVPERWYQEGERRVAERRAVLDPPPARNIILFIGDGMNLATVNAARILQGQQRGETGEENLLSFEYFDHSAFAKTYNTNQQSPDSAGTMTAIATGVKTRSGVLGLDQRAIRGSCNRARGTELVSILELAAVAGLRTGIVTTTRVTHATPAALYAKASNRDWEIDRSLSPTVAASGCRDIARQLIEFDIGTGINVILGGGRQAFMPMDQTDPEYPNRHGLRVDGRDLIQEWRQNHPGSRYVWNQAQFDAVPSVSTDYLLGLFEPSHMRYDVDREHDSAGEPTLARMVRKAIKILERGEQGYVLVVEAGRIDHAHHANNAWRALTDTLALDAAVRLAIERTDPNKTLILVTADHGHALVTNGYAQRGNPIMGLVHRPSSTLPEGRLALDSAGQPYTTLAYTNGPGYRSFGAPNYSHENPAARDFLQEALRPMESATHSGEDVPVYATGPGSQVVSGVMEQNVLFHVMVQAVPLLAETAEILKGPDGLPQWLPRRP